jgi:hypothetical protein
MFTPGPDQRAELFASWLLYERPCDVESSAPLWQDVRRLPLDESSTIEQRIGIAAYKALEIFFRHDPAPRSADLLDQLLSNAWQRAPLPKACSANKTTTARSHRLSSCSGRSQHNST